jgi:hypothetical protein
LAVLWDFKGLQGLKTKMIRVQIYSSRWPPFGLIPDAIAPHSASSARARSRALAGSQAIVVQEGGGAFMAAGSGLVERYGHREIQHSTNSDY